MWSLILFGEYLTLYLSCIFTTITNALHIISPKGRTQVTYVGSFQMDCVYDRFRNSTCVQSEPGFQLQPDEVVGTN